MIVVFPLFPTYPSLTNIERMAFSADLHGPRIGRVYTYPMSTYHAFSVLCISYNRESSYIAYDTTSQSDWCAVRPIDYNSDVTVTRRRTPPPPRQKVAGRARGNSLLCNDFGQIGSHIRTLPLSSSASALAKWRWHPAAGVKLATRARFAVYKFHARWLTDGRWSSWQHAGEGGSKQGSI